MNYKVTFLLSVFIASSSIAQDYDTQRRQFIAGTILTNGVVSGICALTNKGTHDKPLNVFLKGFGQGCLGGTVQIIGKDLTYQIKEKENLGYAWPARLINSAGSSITQNAAYNRNFWEHWNFNLGLLKLEYDVKEHDFKARIFASSIYGVIQSGSQAKFNFKKTLQSGILIFETDKPNLYLLGMPASGFAVMSSIATTNRINPNDYYKIMAHETMHILQYENLVFGNALMSRIDQKLMTKYSTYNALSKYFVFDLNGLSIYGIYLTQIKQPWECRFIEREADIYTNKVALRKCK